MEISKTTLDSVLLIKPDIFEDHRGHYIETYNKENYRKNGIDVEFVQDDISVSSQNVLRGIHGDSKTWKLVSCLYGKFYLVVVNCNTESKDFGKWESFILSDRNALQVLIPPMHGNGHLALSSMTIFHYKQSSYYDPSEQFTYKWDDSRLGIWWPIKNPILSQRDEQGHYT